MAAVFTLIGVGTLGALILKDKIIDTDKTKIKSRVNGKKYEVMNHGDPVAAADMLATLEERARAFIQAAAAKYPEDETIKRIKKIWTGAISEIPQSETIAYTLNKKELFMCVRDNNGIVQNEHDLLFVLLHELSHVMNDTYGHDKKFWTQFKRVLEMANKLGYLPYENYDRKSVTVCGKQITSNPATCAINGTCRSELGPIRPR
jgi:hypothetical protein